MHLKDKEDLSMDLVHKYNLKTNLIKYKLIKYIKIKKSFLFFFLHFGICSTSIITDDATFNFSKQDNPYLFINIFFIFYEIFNNNNK